MTSYNKSIVKLDHDLPKKPELCKQTLQQPRQSEIGSTEAEVGKKLEEQTLSSSLVCFALGWQHC